MKHDRHHSSSLSFLPPLLLLLLSVCVVTVTALDLEDLSKETPLVTREKREVIAETEFGTISAVEINGVREKYQLHFITMDPNSLFLPVMLHSDMVFYVQSGSGSLSWIDEDGKKKQIDVKRGDISRIVSGSVFFAKSSLKTEREKLRICAIFTNANDLESSELYSRPYSTLSDLVTGFDQEVLQAAFHVSEGVISTITQTKKPPSIVHAPDMNKTDEHKWSERFFEVFVGGDMYSLASNKKKMKTFNIMEAKPDFENCNGWSKTVKKKDLSVLKGSDVGVFMVNLTQGSMMGPHWNPRASEIGIVLHGQGMVRVVCPRVGNMSGCENRRFRVKEGDVFVVPRFHPMAQMAFNNDSLVFVGFSTMARKNYPQFLAGERSVLQSLDKEVLAMAFNVPNRTVIEELLGAQRDSIILGCVSCAEEEERKMMDEIEREKEEEARREEERKRQEEEARRREEEERRRQEEEARRREEAAARKREEEEAREREAERKAKEEQQWREEEAKREEEEAKRREEERIAREEEEAREREAERKAKEEQQRREEEAKREEEEARRREQERIAREEEEAREREAERKAKEEQQQREEEAKREEDEAREREAERKAKEEQQQREEEAKREEEEAQRREEERIARREEEAREKEAQRQVEEEQQRRAEAQREQEEAERRQEEEEAARRQAEEAARRQQEEEAARRQEEEEAARRQEEERTRRREEEATRRQEEKEAAREQQQEEAARGQEEEAARRQEDQRQERRHEEERQGEQWPKAGRKDGGPRKIFLL